MCIIIDMTRENLSPNIGEHSTEHATDLLSYFQAEIPEDPTIRRDYLSRVSSDDFISMLQRIRQITETGEATEYPFDGYDVVTGTLLPPNYDDKPKLLHATWDAVKDILNNTKYDDQQALDYASVVAAISVVGVHPFMDGNGRSSRLLSYAVATGGQNPEDIQNIISRYGGDFWKVRTIPEISPHSGARNVPPDAVWARLGDYVTWEELLDSFHVVHHCDTDFALESAPSLEVAQHWQLCDRKRRAAQLLVFLDIVRDNPSLPLSQHINERRMVEKVERYKRQVAGIKREIEDAGSPGELLYLQDWLEYNEESLRHGQNSLVVVRSILGDDCFKPGKTFPVLDQLLANQRRQSNYFLDRSYEA